MKRYWWLIVGSPTVVALLLMAYVPGLNTSNWFFVLAIAAIFAGLIYALPANPKGPKT